MQKTNTTLALILLAATLSAQLPFTTKQYGWRIEKDLESNWLYAQLCWYPDHHPDPRSLQACWPDDNARRPMLVLVHGGAWVGGCKDDAAGLAVIAQEMAQRGYVVASRQLPTRLA